MSWKGKCIRCTKCCTHDLKWIYFDTKAKKEQALEWAETLGYKIVQIGNGVIQTTFEHQCPQLEKGLCKIQGRKPKWCIWFPDNMDMNVIAKDLNLDVNKILFEGCGFEWIED